MEPASASGLRLSAWLTLPQGVGPHRTGAARHVDGGEVAAAAQDQRLVEGRREMAVVGFDRTVLVRPDLVQGGWDCCG